MNMQIIESERGRPLLSKNGYFYRQKKVLKTGECFWCCTNKSCKAKIYTLGRENVISRSDLNHNHQSDDQKLARKIISNGVKRKAVDDIAERPSKIIHSVLKENNNVIDCIKINDITCVRKTIYNKRRQLQPPLPHDTESTVKLIDNLNIKTIKDEPFVLINNKNYNIIVFSCPTNVKILCESEQIYI
jgi:hypothetical protein